jgi:hypothetical protein
MGLYETLKSAVGHIGHLEPYGSRITGTAIPGSDFDFALLLKDYWGRPTSDIEDEIDAVNRVAASLKGSGIRVLNVWESAKARLVRGQWGDCKFDIVINGAGGAICSELIWDVLGSNPQ